MPIYEYRCQVCRHELEAMQAFSDPPLSECPECQGELTKLISRSAVHFKGGGWYITDYARKEKKAAGGGADGDAAGKAAGDEAAPAASTEAKTETKAAPAESKPAEGKTAAA